MKEPEFTRIGNLIADVLSSPGDAAVAARVSAEVRAICSAFPLYPGRLADYAREQ
jgi:glycine/serine hydroxymethyltransferase